MKYLPVYKSQSHLSFDSQLNLARKYSQAVPTIVIGWPKANFMILLDFHMFKNAIRWKGIYKELLLMRKKSLKLTNFIKPYFLFHNFK